jgi:hypothetical protein
MKRFFPSISKANASTNPQSEETAQSEQPPQNENATETESTPQSGPSISSQGRNDLAYCVANANTRLGVGMNVIISDPDLRTPIEDLDPNIQDVARRLLTKSWEAGTHRISELVPYFVSRYTILSFLVISYVCSWRINS